MFYSACLQTEDALTRVGNNRQVLTWRLYCTNIEMNKLPYVYKQVDEFDCVVWVHSDSMLNYT